MPRSGVVSPRLFYFTTGSPPDSTNTSKHRRGHLSVHGYFLYMSWAPLTVTQYSQLSALVGGLLERVGGMKGSRQGIGKTLQGLYYFQVVVTRSKRFPVTRGYLYNTQGCTLSIWDLHSSEHIVDRTKKVRAARELGS